MHSSRSKASHCNSLLKIALFSVAGVAAKAEATPYAGGQSDRKGET
jgi:hypothetical protein